MTDSQNLAKEASFYADHVANKATAALRRQAYNDGWPSNLSRNLRISHDGESTFSIEYPDDLKADILDLEMGTTDTTPMSTLHRFMNRFDPYVNNYDAKVATLIDELEIF